MSGAPLSRSLAYSLVAALLALVLFLGLGDHLAYLEDDESYHRVYATPWLEQAITFLCNAVAAVGLFFLAREWRERRVPRVAVIAVILQIAIGIGVPVSGVLATCCGPL